MPGTCPTCLLGALVPGYPLALGATCAAAHFLHQSKCECRFAGGTRGEVRFLDRYIYGREEYVRFDSRRGTFEAVTPLGEPDARGWNSRKELLDNRRAQADVFCRGNYGVEERDGVTLARKDQPTVKISHTKAGPLAHHSLLLCTATGYYPSGVSFKWLKNGQEQTEGVGYADEIQNGDWTFLNQAMLETVPQRGDLYTCQVEHSSLKEPITVQWEPRSSNSAQSKVWTGALGAVLGVVFGAAGVSFYLRTRRAAPTVPAAGLIS
ncbi:PREDICTED: H-2 class II histocompatibility antigen, E-S beta chain-like [Gekko japonicus]|uniref:H-2 class II histocompatibility antigen, E-S beta chain-like n=1 Tax=Gekko japonicus TaxID=146911 RepID=A0ABM1JP91_GEKJA|nr:PREDICTED: H-2 class II histocompatibility antigen, E-S beta chain-like [Gekko japonicus]